MRERIAIQLNTPTQDEDGAIVDSWATITGGTVWAQVKTLSGYEGTVARQVNADVNLAIIIRFLDGITPRHRVVYRSRNLDINAVLNVNERRIKTVLLCTEAP